jgi:F-type H+-transporting ATPase subunit delta
MAAEASTLARPYAKAVFELAQEQQALARWSGTLRQLAQAAADPGVAALLTDPRLSRAEVAGVLAATLTDGLDAQGLNLLHLLADNNRLTVLPAIAGEYEALRAQAEQRVDVEIKTAEPVDELQRHALSAAVRKRLARDVSVVWTTDPALIAGAVIRAGDLVIDGSVASELQHLRQALAAP